jgi:REP element-mobilizing transposase RayT
MNRGVQKSALYGNDEDRKDFLVLLRTFAQRNGLKTGSYCLMGNHYHVLVQGGGEQLTRCFHEVDRLWALSFNRRRGGKGHVFQGPFRSYLQSSPAWIVRTSLYIHLNPVGRGLRAPEEYPWSSYRLFLGQGPADSWVEPTLVLRQIGDERPKALKRYRELLGVRLEAALAKRERAARLEEEMEIARGRAAEFALCVPALVKELGVTEDDARRLAGAVGRAQGVPAEILAPALGFGTPNLFCVQMFRFRDRVARDAAAKKLLDRALSIADSLLDA